MVLSEVNSAGVNFYQISSSSYAPASLSAQPRNLICSQDGDQVQHHAFTSDGTNLYFVLAKQAAKAGDQPILGYVPMSTNAQPCTAATGAKAIAMVMPVGVDTTSLAGLTSQIFQMRNCTASACY